MDNGSTDGTPEWLAEHFPQVRLIRNERNLGFAGGNNVGLRAASGDLLVLLNQDTEVHDGWLAALISTFEDEAVGIAGCKLLYPDGTIQHAGAFFYGPRGESEHIGRLAPDDGRFDELLDIDFASGAALAISRVALGQIGLLDEGFSPAYYEDADWCYRARAAGFRVVYQPQAVVTHHESTATDALSHDRKFALHQGRLRFVFKHWPLDRLLGDFGPTERAWVEVLDRSEELMAARRAYLKTILGLPGILAFRHSSLAEADALISLLTDLRTAAVAGLSTLKPAAPQVPASAAGIVAARDQERTGLLQALAENQTLHEHVFTSAVPVLGPVIVSIRNLWNSVSTKWYVRPILAQQNIINAQLVSYLQNLELRLQGQSRDVTENIRELTTLAEHLAQVERRDSGESG